LACRSKHSAKRHPPFEQAEHLADRNILGRKAQLQPTIPTPHRCQEAKPPELVDHDGQMGLGGVHRIGEVMFAQHLPTVHRTGHQHAHREIGFGRQPHSGPRSCPLLNIGRRAPSHLDPDQSAMGRRCIIYIEDATF
jgi:hypothetical protein